MSRGLRKGLTQYGDAGFSLYLRRAFIKALGYTDDALDRPIVGILNSASDYNPCHGTVPDLVAAISRGVMQAGGLPLSFPTISLHESFAYPTSMFLRNLMAMDAEEMIRAQPMDAVVLIGGCDKTVPAELMAAASANVPALVVVTGAMLTGYHKGERLGACTDCRRFWALHRAGKLDAAEIAEVSGELMPTKGTCMVMGTASTMACLAETLGMMLPGGAAPPAVSAERLRHAEESGRHAVKMAEAGGPRPREVMTAGALHNALVVLQAIGGSTNAVVHLAAIAGRLGLPFDLDTLDVLGRDLPVVVDLKPSGAGYMEDLHRAGGLPAVLAVLRDRLDLATRGVTGESLDDLLEATPPPLAGGAVRPLDDPVSAPGALAVLRGSLAPGGAVIKASAASPALMRHAGPALVFEGLEDLAARIDDPALPVTPDSVLVLRGAGPVGGPGMPEAGALPIPKVLAEQGVTDMVRISDARMSGTAYGTVILHVTPEAARGGPLALVQTGDVIALDVAARALELRVEAAELERRRAGWRPPPLPRRGYARLYAEQVLPADRGADFEFLAEPDDYR